MQCVLGAPLRSTLSLTATASRCPPEITQITISTPARTAISIRNVKAICICISRCVLASLSVSACAYLCVRSSETKRALGLILIEYTAGIVGNLERCEGASIHADNSLYLISTLTL